MCDSCGCFLPANSHSDKRNITHADYLKGNLTKEDYEAATRTKVGPDTIAKVKANIRAAVKRIDAGKLSPNKVK